VNLILLRNEGQFTKTGFMKSRSR